MGLERVGDLELNQDLRFEERSWRVQRIGWSLFGLLLLASLLGLFGGPGPLSSSTLGEGTALRLDYERFTRHNDTTTLIFELGPGAVPGDEARIWLNGDYLAAIQIERIEPEPARVVLEAGRTNLLFQIGEAGTAGRISIHLKPQSLGWHRIQAGLEGGPTYELGQFVYP